MGDSLEQRTTGLPHFGRVLTLTALLSIAASVSAQSVKPSGAHYESRAAASISSSSTTKPAAKPKATSKKFRWRPHVELITYAGREPITLPNGLVIDRRYEIPEARMDSLMRWLNSVKRADHDITLATHYSIVVHHNSEGSFLSDMSWIQSFGKANFYNRKGLAYGDTIYSVVPLPYTANNVGLSLLNGSMRLSLRAVGVENESRETESLKKGEPCLDTLQQKKARLLNEYLEDTLKISPDSIFAHSDVAMSLIRGPFYSLIKSGMMLSLPEQIIGVRYKRRQDGICFDREAMGIPEFVDPDTNRVRLNEKEVAWRKERAAAINTAVRQETLSRRLAFPPKVSITPSGYYVPNVQPQFYMNKNPR